MRTVIFTLAFLFLLPWATAKAADCNAPQTQTDMNQCAAQAWRRADAELNAHYRQITNRLKDNAAAIKQLTVAQRAWLVFRDAECAFATSASDGGSIRPALQASCEEQLTRKRTAEFKIYLSCQEGDLSCPVPP